MPQGPNPGPAPFQQANQGLAAAGQGGGPSPVAALVAATQRQPARTQRSAPQPGPRADFSGIQQAGSSIGNALRVKYQREWEERMSDKAHTQRKEETSERIKLEEESTQRSRLRIAAMEITDRHIGSRIPKASRNVLGFAKARAARFGNKAPLQGEWAEFNYLIDASDELFTGTAAAFAWEEFNANEETPAVYQDWMNQLYDDVGMSRPPQIEDLERAHDLEDRESPFAGELRETDLIHGLGGRGFSPAQRVGGNMMVTMSNHALISHQLAELENIVDINAQLKVLDDTAARVAKQNIFKNTQEASIYAGFFTKDMVSENTDKDGVTTYSYKRVEHRPALREEVRNLVRSNLERDTLTTMGPYQNLTDEEVSTMIKGMFGGELGNMVGQYLDMPTDQQTLARASRSIVPGGDTAGLPAFNPQLAHVVNSVLANWDDVMLAIVPTAPGLEGREGKVVGSTEKIKTQLASFYGFTEVDDDEVPLLLGMHNQIRARIKQGLLATSAQGAFDYALQKQGAAVRMDADIHIKELVNQGIEPLEAVIDHYNENMPPYIDMGQEEFERAAIQLFNALGSPTPQEIIELPPPTQQGIQQVAPATTPPIPQPAPLAPPGGPPTGGYVPGINKI